MSSRPFFPGPVFQSLRKDTQEEIAKMKVELMSVFRKTSEGKLTEAQVAARVVMIEGQISELNQSMRDGQAKLIETVTTVGTRPMGSTK